MFIFVGIGLNLSSQNHFWNRKSGSRGLRRLMVFGDIGDYVKDRDRDHDIGMTFSVDLLAAVIYLMIFR